MAREYLSDIDRTLLHLDDPTNRMLITGVMIFKAPIDLERLKATVQARLLRMPRFRQRLVWPRLGMDRPYWEDDPNFDLGYHLQRARLGGRQADDQSALQDVVSLLASTPLDRSRPLWQFHLIENYAECCALILRFHHSIADGVAVNHVILSLTDSDPDVPWPTVQPQAPQQRGAGRMETALRSAQSVLTTTRKTTARLVQEGVDLLDPPSHLIDAGRTGRDAALDLGRFLLLEPDPGTVLKGELGPDKRAAWSAGIPLEDVKVIRRALGGTVNDVLLTVVAGGLRRYLQDRGDPVDSLSIRVTVPVNLRPPDREAELGNRVGAVFVPLPISIADPVCRLGEIVRHMNGRKESLEAPVFNAALHALGHAPARIANTLINTFSTRATAVMTNVMGPQEQRYLAGSPVDALLGWVPTTGRMGVGVSVLSYAGEVRLGVLTDAGLVPDPETIVAGFDAEFEALLVQANTALNRRKE
jgi:diacylglycerol O-acyltransferase